MSKFFLLASIAVGASALNAIDGSASARIRAKARLREALSKDDRVSNPDVIAAVDALAIYNPTEAPARSEAFLSDFQKLNAPEFKGDMGLAEDGRRQYTLGRMTFGIYEPKDLVCAIDKVFNPVLRRDDVIEYNLEIPLSFTDAEGRTASGTLFNWAQCAPLTDDRMGVTFTGGALCPAGDGSVDEECEAVWAGTFGAEFEKKPRKRDRLVSWLLNG